MYLKRLDIQGFKSFADKIGLDFNQGITAVVGPNGSGKSNISDAIRWVLGEQSVKTLRGSKMEDIIFAGTEHRKPLGFAEVSLTIDNSEGNSQVPYSEVTVTRRIFRSGESEYLINKTSCRLKDIIELFMDTGIGRDGYSVIGQGRVDEILSTRSEDRRHIFEEASGIMKFKVRKQEAERKLEQTKQNLLRINDIISELDGQLEPLRVQSEAARKYLDIREGLKELEVNVYLENLTKFKEKVKEYEDQYLSVKEGIDTENAKLIEITDANKQKTDMMKQLEEKLDVSKHEFYNLEGSLERCNSEIKINNEKISNLEQNIVRLDEEVGEVQSKLAGFDKEEAQKKEKLKYHEKQLTDFTLKLTEYEKQMEALLKTLNENERYIEALKNEIMDKLDLQSDKKMQVNNVKTHIEGLIKRQKSIEQEVYLLKLDNDKENMKKEDLTESVRHASEQIRKQKAKLSELQTEKTESDRLLNDLRKKESKIKSDAQFKISRHKLLSDMEQNLEGYNRSVKQVLQACHQSPEFGRGIHGALAQLIKVDKKYETAIEMTLGGALQNIITSTEEDAKKAIEFLKSNKLGRATFLPISSVNGRSFEGQLLNDISRQQGFCGIASDLVAYEPQHRGIIMNLLGKVVIAENLDYAVKIARSFNYSFRIVTLDGDILSTSGSMTGGSIENRGPGILSRNREITELKAEIDVLRREEAIVEKDISSIIESINEVINEISGVENEIKNNELVKIRDESHLSQVEENIRKTTARVEMLHQEKEQLIRQQGDTEKEMGKYNAELIEIENSISEAKKIIAEHQEKHKEDQTVRDALHADITDFKISVNSIKESMQTVQEAFERINSEKDALLKGVHRRSSEKARNMQEIEALRLNCEGILANIKKHEEARSGRTFEIDRITEERKVLEEEMSDIITLLNDINKNILLMQEEYGRIEVRKAKLEAEMEAMQNRMWDEYELTYSTALALKKDIGGIVQAQKKISEYRNQIKDLGPVNVAAIEEYVKTKERFEFMSIQRNDMEQAEEKLRRVIYEMTSIMKKQFVEQFKLINENFGLVFKELFGGGRAELILTDKENVLDSGIEIEVQPPGKKLQNMMLLSGGERAFTAIALLFAILKLKPSPFCILDEIEAALDDANVNRFAEYIRRYSATTQFIMVTHRKGTMEGSDTLYGVTMQEHGVSRIISMKMGEKVG